MKVAGPSIILEERGTQVQQGIYTHLLAQTDIVGRVEATTNKMDINESTTTVIPAAPLTEPAPLLLLLNPTMRAFVVYGVTVAGHFVRMILEVAKSFRGKGGGIIEVQLLLHLSSRGVKTSSLLVVYLGNAVVTAKEICIKMQGRKYSVVEYK